MSLSRLLAYPFIAIMTFGVAGLATALIWGTMVGHKSVDLKGIIAASGFITWWSWLGISVYVRHIKKPREEMRRQKAAALAYVEKAITLESSLSATIEALKKDLPLVGEPRHRPSPDPSCDALVEMEAHGFIISLFSCGGVVKSWNVR
jgi:hypothetical protein